MKTTLKRIEQIEATMGNDDGSFVITRSELRGFLDDARALQELEKAYPVAAWSERINALTTQLDASSAENAALRKEVEGVRKALEEIVAMVGAESDPDEIESLRSSRNCDDSFHAGGMFVCNSVGRVARAAMLRDGQPKGDGHEAK